MSGTCPDENQLNRFVSRQLERQARHGVEEHLDSCMECLHVVAAMVGAPATSTASAERETVKEGRAADASPETLRRGEVLGRYRIEEVLGQGGMGTVYLAYDAKLGRKVALKVVRGDRLERSAGRARMSREAMTMAKLAHPNVVTVYDTDEVGDRVCIAMERIDGGTLAAWLRDARRSRADVVRTFVAAGRGLSAAHAIGVVHRDFKPENVLIGRSGRVAVTDFGLASAAMVAAPTSIREPSSVAAPSSGLTRPGTVLGTPRYMSPEQRAGETVGAKSDQYSFAVALYEALFLALPFAGDTPDTQRVARERGELRAPSCESRSGVPKSLRSALRRALAPDPDDRFPTLDALLDEIAPYAAPPARRRAAVVAVAGAAALGLVAAIAAISVGAFAWRDRVGPTVSAPSSASAPLRAASVPSSVRTAVVVLGIQNATGDARVDGVAEAALATALAPSKRLDAYSTASLRAMANQLAASDVQDEERIAREVGERDGRPVLVVGGRVGAVGDTPLALTVRARALDTNEVIFDGTESAADGGGLVGAAAALAVRLRAAIGEAPTDARERQVSLSSSLDALHEWIAGVALRTSGDYNAAIPHLRAAIAADPAFAEAHAALGLALFDLTDFPAAAAELRLALKDADRLPQRRRLALLAASYEAEGQFVESIAAAEQLLSAWPGDLETETAVTATAVDAGDWPLALELGRRAVGDHRRAVIARSNLVLAELGNEGVADAVRDGDALVAEFARPSRFAFAFTAMAHALSGDRVRALDVYDRLAAQDPEYADEGRADLAVYEGRLDDAESVLRGQVDAGLARGEPWGVRTEYVSLARVLLRRNDKRGAVSAARAVLGGGSVRLQYQAASLLAEAGDPSPASEFARTWADHPSPEWRAFAKLAEGDVDRARGALREAEAAYLVASRFGDGWMAHERLGRALLAQGRWSAAEDAFSFCLARSGMGVVFGTPTLQLLPDVFYGLARAREGGKSPLAAEAYAAVVALSPAAQDDPLTDDARRRLAKLGGGP
jgi:tetratricopeptide (TPR) repeat protein/tRNA A-37 threonylcarbamoyl transferase component Bud32